jgi:hypothetical protein
LDPSNGGANLVIRRIVWLVCLGLVIAARASGAQAVIADFDGDGHHDRATVEGYRGSVVRVWLSKTRTLLILHIGSPILGIAARDLDGDRRDDLIAGGSSGLQIWAKERHDTFRRIRPRGGLSEGLERPARTVDEASGGAPVAVLPDAAAPLTPTVGERPRPPSHGVSRQQHASTAAVDSARCLPSFAPRPPPLAL